MPKLIDISGQVFGNLTVVSRVSATGQAKWLCHCICGKQTIQPGYELRSGLIISCGCSKKSIGDSTRTHGKTGSPEYVAWVNMRNRCYRPETRGYDRYGGSGVTVSDAWRNSFQQFYDDMGERPPGATLDRKENSIGYCKSNCRWADSETQQNNKDRVCKVTIGGATKPLSVWCRELNMPHRTVRARVYDYGWDAVRALTTPVKPYKKR